MKNMSNEVNQLLRKEHNMHGEDYEDLIQIEAEELAELLFGESYYALSPDLRGQIRTRAIDSLQLEYSEEHPVAA
jgi:hypothetical protein